MNYFIGIDPGQTGAVALLSDSCVVQFKDYDEPLAVLMEMLSWVQTYRVKIIALEEVHSMPKQGVASTFKFGGNFGWYKGALDMISLFLGIPWCLVRPQEWQRGVCSGKGADADSLTVARRMYPDADLSLKKHHGRADALLIAAWAKKKWSN